MAKVIGYQHTSFVTKDTKETISGINLWFGEDITKNGNGCKVERVFLSQRVLEAEDYIPVVGEEIRISYNRYGKVDSIKAV